MVCSLISISVRYPASAVVSSGPASPVIFSLSLLF